jgi:hypothetical protein
LAASFRRSAGLWFRAPLFTAAAFWRARPAAGGCAFGEIGAGALWRLFRCDAGVDMRKAPRLSLAVGFCEGLMVEIAFLGALPVHIIELLKFAV